MKTSMSSLRNKDNNYNTELPGTCRHVRMVEKLFEKTVERKTQVYYSGIFAAYLCFLLMIILPYKELFVTLISPLCA